MKLLYNKALYGRINSIRSNAHARLMCNSIAATSSVQACSDVTILGGVTARSMHSSLGEAVYFPHEHHSGYDFEAHNFGYRVVPPIYASPITATMTRTGYDEDYDEYYLHMSPSHVTNTSMKYQTRLDTVAPAGNILDTLEAHREWDAVVPNATADAAVEEDDPYLSDFEEMKDNWDIDSGVTATKGKAVKDAGSARD
jgi:hypothetical protein